MNNRPLFFPMILALLVSCSQGPKEAEETAETDSRADTTPVNEVAGFKFSYSIANLPPPMQILDEFASSGLEANTSLLNPVSKASDYHTSLKQAFNYGVYGIDLAYVIFNERTPEILKYYPVVKSLAGQLDMSELFNQFVNRFEENSENRDSLTRITDEVYTATDTYLRSNERLATASEILAGSWIECQYIVVHLLLNTERTASTEVLYTRLWEQRLYLDNITKLLQEFHGDPELDAIREGFERLLTIYLEPAESKDITREYLDKLAQHLTEVRGLITG